MESLGGIDDAAVGNIGGLRHRKAGANDEIDFRAGIAGTRAGAAPSFAGTLNPHADEHENAQTEVQVDRVKQEAFEGIFVGDGDGEGHLKQSIISFQ